MNIVVYPASANTAVLIRDYSVMPGVMWALCAGACTSVTSLLILFAASMALLGKGKILLDCWPVDKNGSESMPTLEVARLSMTAGGLID